MGFQERMMGVMMGRKSPEDTRKMMGEMMPMMMDKMGPEGMAGMMGEMMPRMMESMGSGGMGDMMPEMMKAQFGQTPPGQLPDMMEEMMPPMMDHCFSVMDREQRQAMLGKCRGMLDQMEEKYLKEASPTP